MVTDTTVIDRDPANIPHDAVPMVFNDSEGCLAQGYVVTVHTAEGEHCIAWDGFTFIDSEEHVVGQPYDDEAGCVAEDEDDIQVPVRSIEFIEIH